MTKDYITLLGPFIGGLLALAGVYLSNYLTRTFNKANERNKIKREKLEEAYHLVCATERWACSTLTPPNHANDKEKSGADSIVLLCNCYSNLCSEMAEQLKSSTGVLASVHIDMMKHIVETGQKPNKEHWDAITEPFTVTCNIARDLRIQLIHEIRSLI
jgi:hypothetical protein